MNGMYAFLGNSDNILYMSLGDKDELFWRDVIRKSALDSERYDLRNDFIRDVVKRNHSKTNGGSRVGILRNEGNECGFDQVGNSTGSA